MQPDWGVLTVIRDKWIPNNRVEFPLNITVGESVSKLSADGFTCFIS